MEQEDIKVSETESRPIEDRATLRSFVLGAILAGVFAWFTVMRDNGTPAVFLSKHLLPVLPYMTLFLIGILINPFLKLTRIIRPFSVTEKLQILVMCAVSAGVASFSLAGHLVPLISGLSHPQITNKQTNRDIHAMPFLNEKFFIIEEGAQGKAKTLREAHLEWEKARKVFRVASDLHTNKKLLEKAQLDMVEAEKEKSPAVRAQVIKKLRYQIGKSTQLLATAESSWQELGKGLEPSVVMETYAEKISGLKDQRDVLREELEEFNLPSVEAVKLVREGLPEEMRALPGIIYEPGEGSISYWARYDRLRQGLNSKAVFEEAYKTLEASISQKTSLPSSWSELMNKSADLLDEIASPDGLKSLQAGPVAELEREEKNLADRQKEIRELTDKRRFASSSEFAALDIQVEELKGPEEELKEKVDLLRELVDRQVVPFETTTKFIQETQASLRTLASEEKNSSAEALSELKLTMDELRGAYRTMDASWTRYLVGDGEWGRWLGPIFQWLILVFLGYLVFMTFNNLIYRQWAHHEKLMYPIAEVTTILAADGTHPSDRGPLIYRSGLFWFGFALSAGILGWNYLASSGLVPNINPIQLSHWTGNYVGGSFLSGAGQGHFAIVFAIIGLAFLVPANISYSIWFSEFLMMGVYVVLAWLGYGVGRQTFGNYARVGLGGGAMIVFGLFTLWTCRHYLLCAMRPKVLEPLEEDERRELRLSSWFFHGGMTLLILMLTFKLDVNFFHTLFYMVMALIVTIAMIRAVAEGGIFGLENSFGPFALMTKIFGTAKAWTAPHLFAPLMVYNSLFVGSLKGFIAPGMANAFKIRERMRIKRLHFHLAVWTGIIVAVAVSVVTLVILSYDVGADNLNDWLNGKHGHAPGISGVIDSPNIGDPKETSWFIAGIIIMTLILIGRRSFFWIPHPIGMVLFINPVMLGFWGSIMIGWMAKNIVSKYCSEEQYLSIRCFFVGLIIGHLFAGLVGWDVMNMHWG